MFTVDDTTLHPEGDWIASFATNGSNVIGAVTANSALTDNTTGAASTTLAAGEGVETVAILITLASITGNADVLTNYTPGYKFKLLSVSFAVGQPVTTGAKLTDLNLEIGAVNVTGGVVSLTSANCTPLGALVAGTAITAANTGSAADTISIESANTTAFVEGNGYVLLRIQNMDTADAAASLAARNAEVRTAIVALTDAIKELSTQGNANRVDSVDTASLLNTTVDALQTAGIVS